MKQAILYILVALAAWFALDGAAPVAYHPPVAEAAEPAPPPAVQPIITHAPPPAAPAAPAPATPERITLAAVGLDANIIAAHDSQYVPPIDAAWYAHSAAPGQGENVVIYAHNYSAFRPLERAQIGHTVDLHTGQAIYRYQIYDQVILPEAGQPLDVRYANGSLAMDPTGYERLTLITCWPFPSGDSHRLLLFGQLVETIIGS